MRKIRRMVSVVMISCMMAGCLAGCGSGKETGGTHGERQGTESRSGTEKKGLMIVQFRLPIHIIP